MSLKELGRFLKAKGYEDWKSLRKEARVREVARLIAEEHDDWEEAEGEPGKDS